MCCVRPNMEAFKYSPWTLTSVRLHPLQKSNSGVTWNAEYEACQQKTKRSNAEYLPAVQFLHAVQVGSLSFCKNQFSRELHSKAYQHQTSP